MSQCFCKDILRGQYDTADMTESRGHISDKRGKADMVRQFSVCMCLWGSDTTQREIYLCR